MGKIIMFFIKRTLPAFFVIFLLYGTELSACPEDATCSHAITMFGEQPKYGKDFKNFDYTNPDAPKGGELKMAVIGTYDNLNPYILKGVAAAGTAYLYDSLLTSSNDETFSKYGLIAKEIILAKDKSWVEFILRDEAKWHDGKQITVDDIIFSFEIITTKGHPFYRSYYQDIKKAVKTTEGKVRFIFKNTTNRELPLIVGDLPILPKHYYDSHDFTKTTLKPPLGSGAYKIAKVNAGKSITYERVKNYWAKDLPVNKGRYNFDTIKYDYYRDATVAVEAFKAGEYDLRQENISKTWANSYNIPQIKEGKIIKEEIPHQIPTGMQAFVFNTRKSKFQNWKIRKALSYAFDFEWTNKNLFNGAYTRTNSYFSNSIYASNSLPSDKELELLKPYRTQLQKEVFDEEWNAPISNGSGNNRQNLRIAKKLIEESQTPDPMNINWHMKEGKLVRKLLGATDEPLGEEEFKIEFLLNSSSFERVVAPVIQNLKRLGITATMRTVDPAQYIKRIEEFDFDIIVNVFGQSNSPGNEQMDYWHSSNVNINGSRNLAGIDNPIIDALTENIVKAKSQEELITATKALDRVLLHNYYVIPNWHVRTFRIVRWNKFGRPDIMPKYSLGLDNWWVSTLEN